MRSIAFVNVGTFGRPGSPTLGWPHHGISPDADRLLSRAYPGCFIRGFFSRSLMLTCYDQAWKRLYEALSGRDPQ